MRTATTIDAQTKRRVDDVFRILWGGRWIRLVCLSRRSSTSKRSHTTYRATMLRWKLYWSCCASPHCVASYGDNVSRRTTHVYLMQHHVCCNLKYGRNTLRDKVARKMPPRIITPKCQVTNGHFSRLLKLPLGNAETDDQKQPIFKANKMFLVCLSLQILFHEVQAISTEKIFNILATFGKLSENNFQW